MNMNFWTAFGAALAALNVEVNLHTQLKNAGVSTTSATAIMEAILAGAATFVASSQPQTPVA